MINLGVAAAGLRSDMEDEANYTLVYGLSADPVHQMHVDLLLAAAQELSRRSYLIGRIVIVPVYRRNPVGERQKERLFASYDDRFAMCRLAAREISRGLSHRLGSGLDPAVGRLLGDLGSQVYVSNIEQQLAENTENPNYTVETIQALQSEDTAGEDWILLIGSDPVSGADPELQHWRQLEQLVQMAIIAIYPRPGYPANGRFLNWLEQKGGRIIQLDGVKQSQGSASQVRRLLEEGQDPLTLYQDELLPELVALYIKERELYSVRR